jgi:hypothetical protein
MKLLKDFSIPNWMIPVFLALLCFFSFGILIPWLGFYWDDWAKILVYRLQGSEYYWPYYVGDRPLSAWTHVFFTPILGVTPAAWQYFVLGLRFLSAWGVYVLLTQLRPENRVQAGVAAGIFAVYPLFSQQAIAVTFHQQWLQFMLIIFSFIFMVKAVRTKHHKFVWMVLSILFSILQLSVTEYFAPLELLRPYILWFAINNKHTVKEKFEKTLINWLPYLILIAVYIIWRLFLMPLPGDDPYKTETLFNFFQEPGTTLTWLMKTLVVDLSFIFMGNWSTALETRLILPLSLSFMAVTFGSIVIGAISAIFLHFFPKQEVNEPRNSSWTRMAVTIGLVGALLGPIPAWVTQRQVVFDFHSDRYALPAILGLSILTAGIIEWLGRTRIQKVVLAGLIIMLGSGYQLRTAIDYRNVWNQQMRLYWQMHWRAPQLKNPTAVYSEYELVPNQGLFSMSAALNQLYPQDENPDLLDFWFFTLRPKFNSGAPASVSVSNNSTFRTLQYIGNSPNTLMTHLDPTHGNCLWILRPEDKYNPYLPELPGEMLALSNLERIIPDEIMGYPPAELFGNEPDHDWCYAFQKAELAWQFEEWQRVVEIGNQLKTDGITPISGVANSPREWWPFIVGYAKNGDVREAITISQQSLEQDKRYHEAICAIWKDMRNVPEVGVGLSELGCLEN